MVYQFLQYRFPLTWRDMYQAEKIEAKLTSASGNPGVVGCAVAENRSSGFNNFQARVQSQLLFWGLTWLILLEEDAAMLAFMFC